MPRASGDKADERELDGEAAYTKLMAAEEAKYAAASAERAAAWARVADAAEQDAKDAVALAEKLRTEAAGKQYEADLAAARSAERAEEARAAFKKAFAKKAMKAMKKAINKAMKKRSTPYGGGGGVSSTDGWLEQFLAS